MNKIKSFIKEASKQLVEIYKRFPISMIVIAFITIVGYIQLQFDAFNGRTFERIMEIFMITSVGTVFVESFDKKKTVFTYVGSALALVIGYVFYKLMNLEEFGWETRRVAYWLVAYLTSLMLGIVYVLNKKSGQDIKKYLLGTFCNGLQTGIYYGVFCLGTLLLYAIISLLFTDGGFDVYVNLLELTFGLVFIPFAIGCFTNIKEDIAGFLKGLIKYVLFPIAIIATVLIYIYFAKIFISQEIPSNQIFPIIAVLFVTAFPVLIISNELGKEEEERNRLNKIYSIAYIPFILMEIYSMGVRVGDYGLTMPRYIAFAYVIMQIVLIGLIIYKGSKYLDKFLLAGIIATIVVTISPFSAENVSLKSQKKRYYKAMETLDEKGIDSLSEEELKAIYNPYKYILDFDESFEDERMTEDLKTKLYDNHVSEYSYNKYNYKYYDQYLSNMDISDYSRIYEVYSFEYEENGDALLKTRGDKINVKVNREAFENTIDNLKEDYEDYSNIVIPTNDSRYDFYFTDISVRTLKATGELDSISSMQGYLLEKTGE